MTVTNGTVAGGQGGEPKRSADHQRIVRELARKYKPKRIDNPEFNEAFTYAVRDYNYDPYALMAEVRMAAEENRFPNQPWVRVLSLALASMAFLGVILLLVLVFLDVVEVSDLRQKVAMQAGPEIISNTQATMLALQQTVVALSTNAPPVTSSFVPTQTPPTNTKVVESPTLIAISTATSTVTPTVGTPISVAISPDNVAQLAVVMTITTHTDTVYGVTFSHDGNTIAAVSADKRVLLWTVDSGAPAGEFTGEVAARAVAFAPNDPNQLVVGWENGTASLLHRTTGTLTQVVKLQVAAADKAVESVAFSPDGKLLATGADDKRVRLWQAVDGKEIISLPGHTEQVLSLAFSPDSTILASASADKTVRLWHMPDGIPLITLSAFPDWVRAVAFSPDGRTLAVGARGNLPVTGRGILRLYSGDGWKDQTSLSTNTFAVTSLVFSRDGKLVALATSGNVGEGQLQLWSTEQRKSLRVLPGGDDAVWSVALSTDGATLATGGSDKIVRLWRVPRGSSP